MRDNAQKFRKMFLEMIDSQDSHFSPLVFVKGAPRVGKKVCLGLFSEINANGAEVIIGDNCDIASFVSINVSDSHKRCIGLKKEIERRPIVIESNVFIGSHCFVKGNVHIGHHSVVAAGTIVEPGRIPPYSLVYGNPMKIKKGYYRKKI